MSEEFPLLQECEELLTDPAEWFFRQVNPKFVDDDIVDKLAFRTTDVDEFMLSGARSLKQTAQGAYDERQAIKAGSTAGTWGLTLAQVQQAGSRVVDDSGCPPPEGLAAWPLGHAYLDQRLSDNSKIKSMRLLLARDATRNLRLYPSTSPTDASGAT